MATIHVEEHFNLTPAQLWARVTDAELLQKLGACDSVQPAEGWAGGLFDEGAVREVRLGKMVLLERVVNVQKERSFEVEVLKLDGPLQQDYERVELRPRDSGCVLAWTVALRLRSPIFEKQLSGLVAMLAKPRFRRLIRRLKAETEQGRDVN
jgi:hypothetical protein